MIDFERGYALLALLWAFRRTLAGECSFLCLAEIEVEKARQADLLPACEIIHKTSAEDLALAITYINSHVPDAIAVDHHRDHARLAPGDLIRGHHPA